MKTIDEFRSGLHFRNIAGGSRSFEDLAALRDLLRDEAWGRASVIGKAVSALRYMGDETAANEMRRHGDEIVTMFEEDVKAIHAFLEKRGKE